MIIKTWYDADGVKRCDRTERSHLPETRFSVRFGNTMFAHAHGQPIILHCHPDYNHMQHTGFHTLR